jgi:peptidoglycan/LPS O-acetylase OafA/YrhL
MFAVPIESSRLPTYGWGLIGTVYFNEHGSFGNFLTNLYGAAAAVLNIANITQAKVLILGNGMFGAYWSLSLEEQFYLVFPLFLLLASAKYRVGVICLSLVILAALWRKSTGGFSLKDAFAIDPMLFGILVYLLRSRIPDRFKGGQVLFLLLLFVLLAVPVRVLDSGIAYTLVGLVSGLLVLLARSDQRFVPDPLGLLSWVGRRSYGLYLAHGPCIAFVLELQLSPAMRTTVWLCLTFGVTALLYRYVELPLVEVGRERAKRLEQRQRGVIGSNRLGETVPL